MNRYWTCSRFLGWISWICRCLSKAFLVLHVLWRTACFMLNLLYFQWSIFSKFITLLVIKNQVILLFYWRMNLQVFKNPDVPIKNTQACILIYGVLLSIPFIHLQDLSISKCDSIDEMLLLMHQNYSFLQLKKQFTKGSRFFWCGRFVAIKLW